MRKNFDYDYLVIGGGAAGRVGALMAANSGLKTAIMEANEWGGTGINKRDLPYTAGLSIVHKIQEMRNLRSAGAAFTEIGYDMKSARMAREKTTRELAGGSKKALLEAGVDCFEGRAKFTGPHTITDGERILTAENFLLATGAKMTDPGIEGLREVPFYTPENALKLTTLPKAVFVIGAGSTGCEIAQYFAEAGTLVLIADLSGRLLPKEDEDIGEALEKHFKQNLKIHTLTKARVYKLEKDEISKKVFLLQDGREKMARVDAVILATGTAPATDLDLEKAGIEMNKNRLELSSALQTSAKHIFAAGDIVGEGISSTEKAEYEAALATANMINKTKNPANYKGFVRLTRTNPMIAVVGMSEDDAIRSDYKIRKAVIPMSAAAGANLQNQNEGMIKLIADKQGKLLGATVMAAQADLIIQELALAVRHEMNVAEIANTPHIATSLTEAVRIAARSI